MNNDRARFATSYTIVFVFYLSKQFKQNTCNLQVFESFYLKYGIYKLKEVKNLIEKRVRKHNFSPYSVNKSHIFDRTITTFYLKITNKLMAKIIIY